MNVDIMHQAVVGLGRALRPARAGMSRIASRSGQFSEVPDIIHVSSTAIGPGGGMDWRYTADGFGASPPLRWEGLPAGTESVMLLVEDADIPIPTPLVHALVLNIPRNTGGLRAGSIPFRARGGVAPGGILVGRSGFGRCGWVPPSPPPGHGVHRYVFQVFALDAAPRFEWPPGRGYALRLARPHIIGRGSMIGLYQRR